MMNSINITSRGKFLLFWVLFSMMCTYPYIFNRILPLPNITELIGLSFVCFGLFFKKSSGKIPSFIPALLITQIVATISAILVTQDSEYFKQILYLVWCFVNIRFINIIGVRNFLLIYNRIVLVVALLGALSFVLSLILGPRILFEYINMDGRPGAFVYATFTNTINGNVIRYSGIFDEPGAMAFWAMFALLTNHLYVKDRYLEKPLIIALFFTLSLAYIIQIALFFFFYYIAHAKMKTKIYTIIFCFAMVAAVFLFVDHDSLIYRLTLGRLGLDSDYDLLGDNNRTNMMELAKKMFLSNPIFGVGPTIFYGGDYAADNPYETLAKDGLFGTFFIYLPLIVIGKMVKFKKDIIFGIFILAVGYLQRPFHTNIIHYTMLYLFVYSSYLYFKEEKLCVKYQ